jgi:hypothetical protein
VCVERERGNFFKKRNGDLSVERERGRQFKKRKKENGDLSIYINREKKSVRTKLNFLIN